MDARIELQVASDMPIDIASAVIKYVMGDVKTGDERKSFIAGRKRQQGTQTLMYDAKKNYTECMICVSENF